MIDNAETPNGSPKARRKPRYSANMQVTVFTKGLNHFQSEKTANISQGGLFICTSYKCEVGEKLHVRIILSDIDSFFDMKAKVAWTNDASNSHPEGIGVEFVDMTNEQKEVISKILSKYVNVKDR